MTLKNFAFEAVCHEDSFPVTDVFSWLLIKVVRKEALYVVHSQINLIYLTLGLNAVSH